MSTEQARVDLENSIADGVPERTDADLEFKVTNEREADWALRKLAQRRRQAEANRELAEAERERIDTWLAERNAELQADCEFFEGHLAAYHAQILVKDEGRKTIKLPGGTLKARKRPDGVEVTDEFIPWALDNNRNDLVRVKHEVDKNAVKQAVLKDGEILTGVDVVKGDLTFSVEVSAE